MSANMNSSASIDMVWMAASRLAVEGKTEGVRVKNGGHRKKERAT